VLHRDSLAAEEKFCPKLVAADASAARDADRRQGVGLLGQEDAMLREWCWEEAHDFRSAWEAGPEQRMDEPLEFPRAMERPVQRPLDA
jgi:hypothetical protein